MIYDDKIFLIAVPSVPPTSVKSKKVSGTTVTITWMPVDCKHQNGYIMYYTVRYGVLGSDNTQTINASGKQATIRMLMSFTTYSIEVAGVNSAGTGEFSPAITTKTQPSEFKCLV